MDAAITDPKPSQVEGSGRATNPTLSINPCPTGPPLKPSGNDIY